MKKIFLALKATVFFLALCFGCNLKTVLAETDGTVPRFDYGLNLYQFVETNPARNTYNLSGEGAYIEMSPISGGYHWKVTFNKGMLDLIKQGKDPNSKTPVENFRYNSPNYAIAIPKGLSLPKSMKLTVYDKNGRVVNDSEVINNTDSKDSFVSGMKSTKAYSNSWITSPQFIDKNVGVVDSIDDYAEWFFSGKSDYTIDSTSAGVDRPVKDSSGAAISPSAIRDLQAIYAFRGTYNGWSPATGYAAAYTVEFDTALNYSRNLGYSNAKMELLAGMRTRESDWGAASNYIKVAEYSLYDTVWYCYNYDMAVMPSGVAYSEENYDNSWVPNPGFKGNKDTIKWALLLGYPFDAGNMDIMNKYIQEYDADSAYKSFDYGDKYQYAANQFYLDTQDAIWYFTNGRTPMRGNAYRIIEKAQQLAEANTPFPSSVGALYLDNNNSLNDGKKVQNFVSLRAKDTSSKNVNVKFGLKKVDELGNIITNNKAVFSLYKGAFHTDVPSGATLIKAGIETTDEGVTSVINNLDSDTPYTLVETTSPNGYRKTENIVFKIASVYSGDRYSYVYKDSSSDPTSYTYLRPYLDYTERKGFRLEIQSTVTDSKEHAEYEWVPRGVEVLGNNQLMKDIFSFEDTPILKVVNYKKDSLEIEKINPVGKNIAGAKLEIFKNDEKIYEWTSEADQAKKVKLDPGTYKVHEVSAPEGYVNVSDFEFTFSEEGKVEVSNPESAKVIDGKLMIIDQFKKLNVSIKKQDDLGAELKGATLRIIDSQGKEIAKWKSEGMYSVDLIPGVYGFEELEAPVGYLKAPSFKFELAESGKITLLDAKEDFVKCDNNQLIVTDKSEWTDLNVSKRDMNGQEIPGAKIQIKQNEKEIASWISEKDKSHQVKLLPGTYTFHEEVAPNGFLKITDFTFTIDQNGAVIFAPGLKDVEYAEGKLIVTDRIDENPSSNIPTENTITFSKQDVAGKEIEGATIEIKKDNEVVATWVSKANESHKEKLAPGTYTFHEKAAPNGYEVVTDFNFTVAEDGKVTVTETPDAKVADGKLVVTDQVAKKEVVFSKQDVAGKEIEGATIEIKKDNEVVATWVSKANESHKEKLAPGTYTFHE
ncbi:SpaA isopeptide-forming pilin-related protein, partial [Enterococcus cecorum]